MSLAQDQTTSQPLVLQIDPIKYIENLPTFNGNGFEIFFPLTSVKLSIPNTERALKSLRKIPIGKFQIISLNRNNPASDYLYKFEEESTNLQEEYLNINNKTGEVYLGSNFHNFNSTTPVKIFTITAYNPRLDTFHMAHMTLEIQLYTERKDFCTHELEKICFWDNVIYSVAENSKKVRVKVGEIGSFGIQYICSQNRIKYSLSSKNQFIELDDRNFVTKSKLDHDSRNPGHSIDVLVKCSIQTSPNSIIQNFERNIQINVLDRNDNGLWFQEDKTHYNFSIPSPHFNEGEIIGDHPIIIRDNDSLKVNAYVTYELHNETSNIIKPVCNDYETDHTGLKNTAISCQFIFTSRGNLRNSPYCFIFEARDMSLETENSKDKRSINATVCITSNIEKITDLPAGPKALAMTARNYGNARKNRKLLRNTDDQSGTEDTEIGAVSTMKIFIRVEYPKDIYVYRTSTNLSRVTQPTNMKQLLKKFDHKFRIIDDPTNAFAITKLGGIIYVHNTTALFTAIEQIYYIKISWLNETKVLFIHLEYGRPENTSCSYQAESKITQTCSQVKTKRSCVKFCGLGTNGGACEYRGITNGTLIVNYATCTPNATNCPDNICDPLEQIDVFLCPQDCMPANKIFGPHTNNRNKQGIFSASGTCICDEGGTCNCGSFALEDIKQKNSGRRKDRDRNKGTLLNQNFTEATTVPFLSSAAIECGPSCMILAIGCPLILFIIIISLIVSRRKYMKQEKRKVLNEKNNGENRTVDLPLVSLDNEMKLDISSDTKWEFQRDLLELGTVLGEGEFGKVVRAYATDIAGKVGVTTTVAVKMLKTGANSVEYIALLSEFQLLQEVSHPNVIKLLGACTKGDSPLLIIEYAKYGSLRSYLRLSRKIECSGVEFTDGVEAITVKDILSFAWQICKGMAYLTDIKLVHRDLAARNVLLAEGKICKISDFGLTRDVYEDDAYLKRSRDRVPVKWMAPESLADHVYTTKSDVWAFGILGWELITLGASPYPGIPPQNLYHLLKNGYRMERPENCSEEIYTILKSCWADDTNARPSFKYLTSQWEKLLGNNAKYLELETISAFSNPLYCDDPTIQTTTLNTNTLSLKQQTVNNNKTNDFVERDSLEYLWKPPKIRYEINDNNSNDENNTLSTCLSNDISNSIQLGYDVPRSETKPLDNGNILRYENDLRFPLNIKICNGSSYNNNQHITTVPPNHYSVPVVKRGRSYMDMTNKTLIPDNLNIDDFEKKMSKNITFRFSSLLNLNEQDTTIV